MAKEVEIKLKLTETGSEQVKKLVTEITNVDEVTRALTESVKETADSFERTAQAGFQFAQIRELINGVAAAFNSMAKPALEFEHAMRATNTMAGKNEAEFGRLKNAVADLSKEIPIARDLLAKGLYQVISNAVPEDNWISFLDKSSRAAVGGLADLEKVVTVTSTVIKNYGLSWDAAGEIQDKIQLTAKNGVTSFEQLAEALPKVTGASAILGISIDELMATFATLTGVSGNTAEVSTQLSAAMMSLISPTTEAAKMAKEMGVQFDSMAVKAAGGFIPFLKNLTVEIERYAKKTGMSVVEIESALFTSSRSLKALIPLTGELAGKFEENFNAMENSAGTIDFVFGQMNSTAEASSQKMKNILSSFTDFAAGAFKVIAPVVEFSAMAAILTTQLMALNKALVSTRFSAFIGGIRKSIASVNALKLALASIPWVAAATGAIMLVNAFSNIDTRASAAIEAQNKLNAAVSKYNELTSKEIGKLDELFDKYKNVKDGTDDFRDARDEFVSKYGDYIDKLGIEIKTVKDLETAYKLVSIAIKQSNMEKALSGYEDVFKRMEDLPKSITTQDLRDLYDYSVGGKKAEWGSEKGWNSNKNKPIVRELENRGVFGIAGGKPRDILLKQYLDGIDLQRKWHNKIIETKKALGLLQEDVAVVEPENQQIDGNTVSLESLRKKRDELLKQARETDVSQKKLIDNYTAQAEAIQKTIDKHELELELMRRKRMGYDVEKVEPLAPLETAYVELPEPKLAQPLSVEATIDVKVARLDELRTQLQGYLDKLSSGVKLSGSEVDYLVANIAKTKAEIAKLSDEASGLNEFSGSVSKIGQAFNSLGSSIEGSAGAMLQWAGQTLSAMAQVVAAIAALIAAREAEKQANAEAAVTGAAASAASTPVVGWILAGAAVASMIALLANMPKFAAGGLAYGPTLGLFGEYSGAANNPEVVAPLSKLKDLIEPAGSFGEVRFEIEGRTLVGVLNKINRFNDRTK